MYADMITSFQNGCEDIRYLWRSCTINELITVMANYDFITTSADIDVFGENIHNGEGYLFFQYDGDDAEEDDKIYCRWTLAEAGETDDGEQAYKLKKYYFLPADYNCCADYDYDDEPEE